MNATATSGNMLGMELSRQISELVARFVARVTDLARELAQDQLTAALADDRDLSRPARAPTSRRLPGPPGRRAPEEIEAVRRRLLAHIEAHPGQRIEEIARALGTTTRALAAPLKKLLWADLVRAQGERRATRYLPAASAPTAARAARLPRRTRRPAAAAAAPTTATATAARAEADTSEADVASDAPN